MEIYTIQRILNFYGLDVAGDEASDIMQWAEAWGASDWFDANR